ncbi:hypothetical protein HDF09_003152 [Edaphobacter lichenicola]|uniref:Uncharacterized protein n=1 Tax=Tunturiibacter empetritectus TaxID=3069691 RepID=A0A7W8IJS7_9BACT|nr:hypothetical protein [Edaphobacter lichenicola]
MPTIHAGRYSTRIEGPFVIFLIGFRINRPLAFNKWIPVAKAMGPMLQELYTNPISASSPPRPPSTGPASR